MDLNASPLPEEDEQPFQEQVEDENFEPAYESSVQTLHREREERRRRLKREFQDEGPKRHPQSMRNDSMTQNKTSKYAGKIRPIPQGWMDCPPFGKWLGGSIVPSKVPLDETYNDAVLPGKRYSSKQVINGQRRFGRELGLVVDLTNTNRYYLPLEYTKLGIKHIKIACKGRDAVPDNESVNRFVYEVMQFIGRQKHSRKNVLVHCTHGHNRTGFMIVHYLVRTKLCSVTEALHDFEVARPPGIYKRDYIEALYSFYHEFPEKIVCPSTPEWKRSSELDLNGEAVQDQDDDEDGDSTSYLHEQHVENGPITNDDVLGDAVCYDEQEFLRQKCYSLFELFSTGKGTSQFPGSHPVSLNRDNLQLLRQRYYYSTWKADGTRYMMLIALHGCYLIDRNFCFRRVQLRFPSKVEFEGYYFHHYTLIDGEMIIDAVPDIGLKRRYLAYDLIALNNQSVVKLPFSERWKLLEEEVIRPRNNEKKYIEREGKGNLTYRYEMEPFGVRRKDFWLLSTVRKLLKVFIPSLSHDSDGLIFQGWDDPYIPRTHEGLLKWKYPEMNSVDFLFEIGTDNRQLVYLYERGKKKLMDGSRIAFKVDDDEEVRDYSGKIIECSWDQESGCWVCMRVRTDKSTPNDINTYKKVMRSISDNITEEVLLNEIKEIISLPMYADRIEKLQQQQRRR